MAETNLYDYSELMKKISEAMGSSGQGSVFGNSFRDQYQSAQAGLRQLNSMQDNAANKDDVNQLKSSLGSMKGSAIAGGAIAGAQGAMSLITNAMNSAQIQDTSAYSNQIAQNAMIGNQNYNSFEQLAADMGTRRDVDINYDDIRGMGGKGVTAEKAMAVGSSTLSGAATGMQIGGPWGAAIGGAVGLLSGVGGILVGDKKAQIQQDFLNSEAQRAQAISDINFEAAGEELRDRNYRQSFSNIVAHGGHIHRRKIKEPTSYSISRSYCKGGLKVSIKRK